MRWLFVLAVQLSCLYSGLSAAPAIGKAIDGLGSEEYDPSLFRLSDPPAIPGAIPTHPKPSAKPLTSDPPLLSIRPLPSAPPLPNSPYGPVAEAY
ncbi:hypothetical protein PtA15_12A106 [Puccinia triticina]|uniref:Uncharacterized protein n=1 Tax=Puccinia triticina TaxID=208348 RepID=A0ABY7CY35_9BASI|nr:uncharacterized protein PtA15_12A106 [Puccinia triticina]WAQ90121.1 hypothetical protein PtA15_12A106 [Puccinia triticina]WAR61407.1 hypothetical protein PtB15_12B92 [Puccinia triticina]